MAEAHGDGHGSGHGHSKEPEIQVIGKDKGFGEKVLDNVKLGEVGKRSDAVVREVEEETGMKAKILQPLSPVVYWYQWEGEKRKKTVYYFLMQFLSEDKSKKDMEMEEVEWLPQKEVEKRLTYPSDKKVWKEAQVFLSSQ